MITDPCIESCMKFIEIDMVPNCTKPFSRGFLRGRFGMGFVALLVLVLVLIDLMGLKTKSTETLQTKLFQGFKLKQQLLQQQLAEETSMRIKDREFLMTTAVLTELEGEKQQQPLPRTYKEIRDMQAAEAYANPESALGRTELPSSANVRQGGDKALDEVKDLDGVAAFMMSATDLPPPQLDGFKDLSEPADSGKDVPVFWHVPKAGGSTIKDIVGDCHGKVLANENGVLDGHGLDTVSCLRRVSMHYFLSL